MTPQKTKNGQVVPWNHPHKAIRGRGNPIQQKLFHCIHMEAGTPQRLLAAPPHRHCLLTDISLQTLCFKNHIYIHVYLICNSEHIYTKHVPQEIYIFFFFLHVLLIRTLARLNPSDGKSIPSKQHSNCNNQITIQATFNKHEKQWNNKWNHFTYSQFCSLECLNSLLVSIQGDRIQTIANREKYEPS